MAFDGFFMRKMVKELEENILNGRINKINNLSTDEFVFSVRKGKNLKLFLSASSSASRIQLTNNSFENPSTPSNFFENNYSVALKRRRNFSLRIFYHH